MPDFLSPNPFRRIGPSPAALPVVLSVPHAGRAYSPALLRASRLPLVRLETLEDRLVDQLVLLAVEAAADLLDTPRTRGGLGLVPARMAGSGAIWRERVAASEIDRRIVAIHRPYHAALRDALEEALRRFGVAVLLDCHSMPPRAAGDGEAQVVLGDRHGTSAAPELVAAAERAVREAGYPVARNDPYAGGHITMRHGHPDRGVHAIQIELDRGTYLAADLRAPGPGFDRAARLIKMVTEALATAAIPPQQAIAAE
jgi:N-formylglutamate amidohydrolase